MKLAPRVIEKLKATAKKEESEMACEECDWTGSEDKLEKGMCPDCGGTVVSVEDDDVEEEVSGAEKMVAALEKRKGEKYPAEERKKMLAKFAKNIKK